MCIREMYVNVCVCMPPPRKILVLYVVRFPFIRVENVYGSHRPHPHQHNSRILGKMLKCIKGNVPIATFGTYCGGGIDVTLSYGPNAACFLFLSFFYIY